MNPLFKEISTKDANYLINYIIMTLHEELNKAENNNLNDNKIIDQSNQMEVFQNFTKEFISKNKSIISDLFFAINCNITECGNCHLKLYNYQIYFFLQFPLEEVLKFKKQSYNINIIDNNVVYIYDCFNYDKNVNVMSGDNAIFCNYCNMVCNSYMYTYLVTGPDIFILFLHREKEVKLNVKVIIEENLNLFNYIEYKNTGFNYKLIGVITSIGESGLDEHFIAYCRDPISEKWYKYNDAIVTEVNNFQSEVLNFGIPFLLFYQKIN